MTQEVRQYPKRPCEQSTPVYRQAYPKQIDLFLCTFGVFLSLIRLKDCELYDFNYDTYFLLSSFLFGSGVK